MTARRYSVVGYVTEEVERQGHDVTRLDGIERVGWMLNAWSYAIPNQAKKITLMDIITIGGLVEREKNEFGFRGQPVYIGGREGAPWQEVPVLLGALLKEQVDILPLEFYRRFEEIHPFIDGNGRTGKILLNWLAGTLLDPIFPPDDFWGHPIRNP